MISALRPCPKCGSEIPTDAPEGGGPGCLLESGLRLLDEEAVARSEDGSTSPKTINAFGERVPPHKRERFAEMLGELGDYELLEEVERESRGTPREQRPGIGSPRQVDPIRVSSWSLTVWQV